MPTSTVGVPVEGRPESKKQRRSIQLRRSGSSTFSASMISENGLVRNGSDEKLESILGRYLDITIYGNSVG